MKKMLYQQLTNFILSRLPESYHSKFYSEMDKGKIINEGRTMTEDGIDIAWLYTCNFLYKYFGVADKAV